VSENAPQRVPYPLFELVGPQCKHPGCKGVLVDTLKLKTKEFLHKCSECHREFHWVAAKEKLD
jgi:hypothetical protein